MGVLLAGVSSTPTGYVAIGLYGPCVPDACIRATRTFTSADGITWLAVEGDAGIDGEATRLVGVDRELIASGSRANDGSKNRAGRQLRSPPTDAAIWTSVDGSVWSAVPSLPVASRVQRVSGAGRHTTALADDEEGGGSSIWRRAGSTWRPIGGYDGLTCCADVAVFDGRVFAIGVPKASDGFMTDGIVELTIELGEARAADPAAFAGVQLDALVTVDGMIVGLGRTGPRAVSASDPTDSGIVLVASADGRRWRRGPGPHGPSPGIRDLRRGPGGLLLLDGGGGWFAAIH